MEDPLFIVFLISMLGSFVRFLLSCDFLLFKINFLNAMRVMA